MKNPENPEKPWKIPENPKNPGKSRKNPKIIKKKNKNRKNEDLASKRLSHGKIGIPTLQVDAHVSTQSSSTELSFIKKLSTSSSKIIL